MMKNRKWMLVFGLPVHCCSVSGTLKKMGKNWNENAENKKGKRFARGEKGQLSWRGVLKII